MKKQTIGEQRVGLTFNPSEDNLVTEYKTQIAKMIDTLEEQIEGSNGEKIRTIKIAQQQLETGCMYAVKSIFK